MDLRKRPDMFTPHAAQPLLPHHFEYTRTSTVRDWSFFDAPAKGRMTAKRLRPAKLLEIRRQAS